LAATLTTIAETKAMKMRFPFPGVTGRAGFIIEALPSLWRNRRVNRREPGKRFLPLEEAAQIARCCILDPRGWLGSTSFSEMSNPVVLLVTSRMVLMSENGGASLVPIACVRLDGSARFIRADQLASLLRITEQGRDCPSFETLYGPRKLWVCQTSLRMSL
jgi:hypothetical protein